MADVKSTPSLTAPASQLSSTAVTSRSTSAAPASQSSSADSTSQTPSAAPGSTLPLVHLKDADVEISILPGAKNDFFLPSTLLKNASPYFAGRLSDNWVEGTLTGRTTTLSDGTVCRIKQFELVFDKDGPMIVAKPVTRSPYLRRAVAMNTINSSDYWIEFRKSLCHDPVPRLGRGVFESPDVQWRTDIAINLFGFAMLCKLPLDHKVIFEHIQHVRSRSLKVGMTCFIHRMVQWVEFYGVLEAVRQQFGELIRYIVPEAEIIFFPLTYLRLAALLQDRELLAIPLTSSRLLYGLEKVIKYTSIDLSLGFMPWLIAYQRSVSDLHALTWVLMNVSDIQGGVSASVEARRTAKAYWINTLVLQKTSRIIDHDLALTHTSMLNLPLAILSDRKNTLMGEFSSTSPTHITESEILEVEALLLSWMASAQEIAHGHMTVTSSPDEKLEFKIDAKKILKDSGYPWEFRDFDSEPRYHDDILLQEMMLGKLEGHGDNIYCGERFEYGGSRRA